VSNSLKFNDDSFTYYAYEKLFNGPVSKYTQAFSHITNNTWWSEYGFSISRNSDRQTKIYIQDFSRLAKKWDKEKWT